MAEKHSPLHQFEIHPLIPIEVAGLDISFTNSALLMVSAVVATIVFLTLAMRDRLLVPSRLQSMAEIFYQFIGTTLKDTVGLEGIKYFPFIFAMFMFILVCNLLGMLPYSFTVTSHIAVTFALAIFIFIAITVIGFIRHGLHFLSLFLPAGTPWWLAPLMVVIELFAYCARPVSLSLRLAANMVAGHVLLKVIAGFVVAMGFWQGIIPIPLIMVLTGFEIFIAVLQAYIFTILVCVYLNDAIHMH